jgi:hypothetical protein
MSKIDYVNHLDFSLKGRSGTVELTPKTLILGRNGAGKSAITQGLELALTGKASDLLGRSLVASGDLLSALGGPGGGGIHARATFASGSVAEFVVPTGASKGKLQIPAFLEVPTVFPLRDTRDALLGSADTMRTFFLKQVGGVTRDQVKATAKEAGYAAELQEVGDNIPLRESGTTYLLTVLEAAAKRARDTKKAESVRATVSIELAADGGLPVEKEELAAARAATEAAFQQWTAAKDLIDRGEAIENRLDYAHRAQKAAKAQLDAAPATGAAADVAATRALLDDEIDYRQCALRVLEGMIERAVDGQAESPIDGKFVEVADLQLLRAYGEEQVKEAKVLRFALDEEQEAVDRAALEETFAKANAEALAADQALRAFEEELQTIPAFDAVAREDAYRSAQTAETDLNNRANAWKAAQRVAERSIAEKAAVNRWNALGEALETLLKSSLLAGVAAFTKRVQLHLPPTDKFHLQLVNGTKEVCRYGLVREGVLHPALSGAEWARVTGALALACVPEAQPYACLVPDDRAWDPETLAAVLNAWTLAPRQVIVATTVEPATVVPGWFVVRI